MSEEFVKITRTQLKDLVAGYCGSSALGELYELASAPPQPDHSAQPVAIVCGSSVQWLPGAGSLKDRAELYEKPQPLDTVQGDAQPAAWVNGEQLLLCSRSPLDVGHSNPLYHNLPRNIGGSALRTDYCDTPLYTHADAGEVERLNSKLETMRRMNNELNQTVWDQKQSLATAERLLRDTMSELRNPLHTGWEDDAADHIEAYLAASAKPEGGEE